MNDASDDLPPLKPSRQRRVAVTMGDPAGVGPELCLAALSGELPEPATDSQLIVFGDVNVLQDLAQQRDADWPFPDVCTPNSLPPAGDRPLVVDHQQFARGEVVPGVVAAAAGKASVAYIETAVQAALNGSVDGIVTGPIHKEAIHLAGCPYPGHTELIANLTNTTNFCMLMTSTAVSCALVTSHIGLGAVTAALTRDRVLRTIQLTHDAFACRLARPPRLAVCGLNPHAGERGLFGAQEEETMIGPAIESARQLGINAVGPLPADTAFAPFQRERFDAYVCMYHDQGLIPVKTLAFDSAINVTLGLPILRSSVDHGTAFDIAWQGQVEMSSFRNAIAWIENSTTNLANLRQTRQDG